MNLKELREMVAPIIKDIKDHGDFPKENSHIDYKLELKITSSELPIDNFLTNFAKDIISFSNADGGIIFKCVAISLRVFGSASFACKSGKAWPPTL